jgi:hypothetical protein
MASGPSINSPTVTGGLSTDTLTVSGVSNLNGGLTVTGGLSTDTLTASSNVSGAALLATGTAVPPAGSPGIYRPAPNQIGFSTNGVNRWTINVSGVLTNQNAGGALNVYGIGGITTGYANSGAAGVALTMSGASINGGTVHISTASVSTDGPIAIGPATTPGALTIAVNGLTTLANGLTVTGTATFNNSLYLGGTPTYGVLLNTDPVAAIGVGTTGQALTSQGASAVPVFTTAAAGIVLATGANNPAAPTSNTGAMAGLGALFTFTPARSGRVMITVSGHANILVASPANAGILLQLYYGTGAAPANGAAVTGTSLTASVRAQTGITLAAGGADFRPVTLIGVITGLAVGTAYWVDVSQAQTLSGTPIAFANITFNFLEQ